MTPFFQIAVVDMNSLSALFLTDFISNPSSTLKSMICKVLVDGKVEHLKHAEIRDTDGQVKNLIFILTMDGAVYAIDSGSGNRISPCPMRLKKDSTAVSLYVIGKYYLTKNYESVRLLLNLKNSESCNIPESSTRASKVLFKNQKQQLKDKVLGTDSCQDKDPSSNYDCKTYDHPSESHPSQELLDELLVLVCCREVLRLYDARSVIRVSLSFLTSFQLDNVGLIQKLS